MDQIYSRTTLLLLVTALSFKSALSYGLACSSYRDPPPGGWKRWSDSKTWPGGQIPGVQNSNARVVVPCNQGIVLDRSITVDQLVINGWLKVVDNGPFQVIANFVIVKGRFTIGTPKSPYKGKIKFTLTSGGYNYTWNTTQGSGTVGEKAFAVIGGSVNFNGMYGNQDPWTTLRKSAKRGDTSLSVVGDVSSWPVGGIIAIASTDYDFRQAEKRKITYIKRGSLRTEIGLEYPLFYNHWGDRISTGVKGVVLSEAAEVALLDRSIVIQGSVEADRLIGGHFIVFKTANIQRITGVELVNMGQQGRLGRYPMHFHLCKSVLGSYVTKISVHSSNQRCVVVHGTFDLLVAKNVAYYTRGHCYVLEDGGEYGNKFISNLGFYTEVPQRVISPKETTAVQSDEQATTFWISNSNNTFLNNVAAGAVDSGFWFQLEKTVLGPTAYFPESKGVYPMYVPLLSFVGNVAHSNQRSGIRTFGPGMKPRLNGGRKYKSTPQDAAVVTVVIAKSRVYKNAAFGLLMRKSDSIIVDGGIFADNRVAGIYVFDAQNITIQNAVILGETVNIGNPTQCGNPQSNNFSNCEPLSGCTLPTDPSKARSLSSGQSRRDAPMFGIMIDKMEFTNDALLLYPFGPPIPIHVRGVTFGKFSNRCKVSAAFGGDGFRMYPLFPAGHRSEQLTFLDDSPRFYIAPQDHGLQANYAYLDTGSAAKSVVFRDMDGTLVGGTGGYVVVNNKVLLPSNPKICTGIVGGSYAWSCPGTCYRTVAISGKNRTVPYFTIRRVSDQSAYTILGYGVTFLNLLSNSLYDISIIKPPVWLELRYADPRGCKQPVTFNLVAPGGYYWAYSWVLHRDCSGVSGTADCRMETSVICGQGSSPSRLRVTMGGKTLSSLFLDLKEGDFPNC